MRLLEFWYSNAGELGALFLRHVMLVGVSTALAIAAGVPLGVMAARRPRLGAPLVWLANVAQTIPSLAMFGFLLPMPFVGGLGARVALVVLFLYALLPILRTTVAGIRSVDSVLVDAGTALGMTPRQLLAQVQFPLALPSIVAGIRVAAVIGVGTATIAAAVGAGGLGEYIFRGLAMVEPTVILAGAVPAALLALGLDGGLTALERQIRASLSGGARRGLGVPLAVAAALAGGLVVTSMAGPGVSVNTVRVGSKNFTEQIILGELIAQTIEAHTDLRVERRLNLGGTFICDRAIRAGEIDIYVEYTGTAHAAIFGEQPDVDPQRVFANVRSRYADVGLTLLDPLGFENTFAVLVRGDDARRLDLRTISDLAAHSRTWRAGFGYEFLQRPDGLPGLARQYGLQFAAPPTAMDLSLIYRALALRQVDVIAGDATSGLIDAYDLVMLEDDRRYFPPYDAAIVARSATMLAHPALRDALGLLEGRITVADMRRLNHAVDAGGQDAAAVVRQYLSSFFARRVA